MLTLLLNKIMPYKTLILGITGLILVASVYFYIGKLKDDLKDTQRAKIEAEKQVKDLQKLNEENLREFQALKDSYKATETALTEIKKITAERDKAISVLKERVRNVRPENEGTVAPVLRDTLASLRERTRLSTDQNQDRAVISSEGIVRVPSPTASSIFR